MWENSDETNILIKELGEAMDVSLDKQTIAIQKFLNKSTKALKSDMANMGEKLGERLDIIEDGIW